MSVSLSPSLPPSLPPLSTVGSLSCHSSRGGGSSAASSRVSSRRPSFSDIEPSPPTSIIDSGGRRISANKNQRSVTIYHLLTYTHSLLTKHTHTHTHWMSSKRMTRNHSSTPISSSNKINKNSKIIIATYYIQSEHPLNTSI